MERQVEGHVTAIVLEAENPTRSSARVGDLLKMNNDIRRFHDRDGDGDGDDREAPLASLPFL